MVRTLLILLACFGLASAHAAGGGGHGGEEKRESGVPTLDLPPFMAPVTIDGHLHFYLYIVIKLDLTSDFKKPEVLEKIPYLQDAIMRDVHARPIMPEANPQKIDEAALSERLKPAIERVLGPGIVAKVSFRTVTRAAH